MTINQYVVAVIIAIIALSTISVDGQTLVPKGATKFRQSLTTLTMGDLPDLEMEQHAIDDNDEFVAGAPVSQSNGVPNVEALSSFQQFLQATSVPTKEDTSLHVMGFSGSGGFSGSDDEYVIGYNLWTSRTVVDASTASLVIELESVTATGTSVSLTPSLLDDSSNVIAGGAAIVFDTTALPTTKTPFNVAINDESYSLSFTASDSTGASDVTTRVLFHSDASWTFGLEASVSGRTATLTQTTKAGVDGYVYLSLAASESRPTIQYVIDNGVAVNVVETGEQDVTFTFAPSATAYGDYVIYVVQVSTYASDSVNIAIGSSIAVSFTSPCSSSPCQNGGVCTAATETTYTCDCSSVDYEGTTCGTKIDNCASSPCQNGGTCIDGLRSYSCNCSSVDYEGTTCGTKIDNCVGVSCHNGTCVDGLRSYSCSCNSGYTGSSCLTNIDDCASSPCQNGGTCVDGIASFTCKCPSAYTGYLCQTTSSTKCNAAPCLNGGVCYNATVTPFYSCVCNANYTGDTCATRVSTSGPTRPAASVRVAQTLTLDLQPAEYPAFKADYAATVTSALKVPEERFSWVSFGPKTTSSSRGFNLQASEFSAQFDLLAPAAGDNSTTANLSAADLLTTLVVQMADPNSTFSQSAYGNVVTGMLKSCSDGSSIPVADTCPSTSTSTSSTGTDEAVTSGTPSKNNNSTWIALGCAVGAFFAILAGFLCYCQRKKAPRVVQSGAGNDHTQHELLGGTNDLQDATFIDMHPRDGVSDGRVH